MRRIVTTEDYFDAAMSILIDHGAQQLTVAALCARLGVTTGSFYGYFRNYDEFVEAFVTARLQGQNRRLQELGDSEAEPVDRLERLRELARTVPHDAEAAIRSWAQDHEAIARVQRNMDSARVEALVPVLATVVRAPDAARRLGEVGMALLIGWQQRGPNDGDHDFDALFDCYQSLIMSYASSDRDTGSPELSENAGRHTKG